VRKALLQNIQLLARKFDGKFSQYFLRNPLWIYTQRKNGNRQNSLYPVGNTCFCFMQAFQINSVGLSASNFFYNQFPCIGKSKHAIFGFTSLDLKKILAAFKNLLFIGINMSF
jgi:hypothetical protein